MADKERQRDGGGGGGDEEEGGVGPTENCDPKDENHRKAKKLGFFRFKKGKKKLRQKRKKKINSGCWAKRAFGCGGGDGCFLCLRQPETDEFSDESPASDPNSKEFTADMLRALIEKNDFYAKECNPHLDNDDCD